jgi:hypothetical protein
MALKRIAKCYAIEAVADVKVLRHFVLAGAKLSG